MSPGKYTELFFLDEATALAAGHRPCAECRNADYRRFKELWIRANRAAVTTASDVSAEQIDRQIQEERMNADGSKRSYASALNTLPDGVVVTIGDERDAFLLWKNTIRPWTPAGYEVSRSIEPATIVNVLNPTSVVRTIAAGYAPFVHTTALDVVR